MQLNIGLHIVASGEKKILIYQALIDFILISFTHENSNPDVND
jgi:hypothetical protein